MRSVEGFAKSKSDGGPSVAFDFAYPAALALLPLAALPWLKRKSTMTFSHVPILPADRTGAVLELMARLLGCLAMVGVIVGLASPGYSAAQLVRTGHGAEVLLLMDRSSSMDNVIAGKGTMAEASSLGGSKNKMARDLLTEFVGKRPNDRFALTIFSTGVMPVAPFTDHNEAVMAGLAATSIGRGLPHTDLGAALLAAINAFQHRIYSGSRVVLLVSDGGAKLDEPTRRRIQTGLTRNRIGLYYIYIRSTANSPNLNVDVSTSEDSGEEMALHRFFLSLSTPYHLYQADDSNAIATALKQIDQQQNLPLSFVERVPRIDKSAYGFAIAAASCLGLFGFGFLRLRSWT
jgi:mxaC protein